MGPPFDYYSNGEDYNPLAGFQPYEPDPVTRYGVDARSPGAMVDLFDVYGAYDDIARKLQSQRDTANQEYADNLKAAMQPRRTGIGETLATALLSFGAPLLGKAIGGNQLGAQGGQMGQVAVQELDKRLDSDWELQQKQRAALAAAAREDVKVLDRAILDLPEKKLGLQGQMAVNKQNNDAVFERQKEIERLQHGYRMDEIGAQQSGKDEDKFSQPEIDSMIALRRREAEQTGQVYSQERETADRAILRTSGSQGPEILRRDTQAQIGYQNSFSLERDGAIQTQSVDQSTRVKTKLYQQKAGEVVSAANNLKNAIITNDPNAIGSAKSVLNLAVKEWGNLGAALTGIEAQKGLGGIPAVQPNGVGEMWDWMTQAIYGKESVPMLDALIADVKTQTITGSSYGGVQVVDPNKFFSAPQLPPGIATNQASPDKIAYRDSLRRKVVDFDARLKARGL